jgi:hypothetical protein
MFLNDDELMRLTGMKLASRQALWLENRGIPHRIENKRVLVLCVDAAKWVRGEPMVSNGGINWGAVT